MNPHPRSSLAALSISVLSGLSYGYAQEAVEIPLANPNFKEVDADGVKMTGNRKNGQRVANYEGPTWFDDKTSGPFFKMGMCRGSGTWKGEKRSAIAYFDEFRVGDKSVSHHAIDPAKQSTATNHPEVYCKPSSSVKR